MRGQLKHIITTILLLLIIQETGAQVDRSNLIGAYTYNFARYTFWQDESLKDSFNIVLISDNKEIIREFKDFSSSKRIKDKPIGLQIYSRIPAAFKNGIRIIFLSKEKLDYFGDIKKRIEDLPILIVTECYSIKYDVMINLYDDQNQKLLFEVNKSNIINHHLNIDSEVLLLGGTEIDVAELYRNLQKEMESLQKRVAPLNDSLDQLNKTITKTLLRIDSQQDNIVTQQKLLDVQTQEIEKGKEEVREYNNQILKWKIEIGEKQKQLSEQSELIGERSIKLLEQENYIQSQQSEIKNGKILLDSLSNEISNRNIILDQQSETIIKQKQSIILAIITGFLAIIIIFSMIASYRNKARKNKLLSKQKEEIERINKELGLTNENLSDTINKLRDTQSQLVSAEKMASLGVLTAGIAHEINNPVNFIYTGINSLKKDYSELASLNEEINKLIKESGDYGLINKIEIIKSEHDCSEINEIIHQTMEDIKIGADRASDIIKGLRNFSRIDKDTMQLFDIHEGIDTSLLLLKNKFKNHIVIEKKYSQLPKIECYPGKLNQAFLNIISNSIDAIEEEGKITIETKLSGDHIVIKFADTGKGIPPEIIDKIFDPFFTTKSVGSGVGLGLSITFGIIQEHKGNIKVKSEINSGTIITILIPCLINND